MFFIVSLIALALVIAAIFGLQLHPVLMVFAFPVIATVYGGLCCSPRTTGHGQGLP
jgi:hypothetical protein